MGMQLIATVDEFLNRAVADHGNRLVAVYVSEP
jgi:hypothetical protein